MRESREAAGLYSNGQPGAYTGQGGAMDNLAKRIAESIAAAIIADGAAKAYMNATDEQRTELVLAYMENEIRKVERIQVMYITNDSFKETFRAAVYALCL
jgi:hypothetical protein